MTVNITINNKFKHLNADRSYAVKVGGVGVEKEIVCDVTVASQALTSGTFTCDFTQVGLKQVYDGVISYQSGTNTNLYRFESSQAAFDAALPEIRATVISTGADDTASQTVNLKVTVRGV